MQKDRREFVKKSAIVVGAGVVIGATTLVARGKGYNEANSNGVVLGSSTKKEITYKKTKAWEDYYNLVK